MVRSYIVYKNTISFTTGVGKQQAICLPLFATGKILNGLDKSPLRVYT
jgi:hypothetical protein